MSASAPSDLAVAFRSLPRRLKEAPGDDAAPTAIATAEAAVSAAIGRAASVLGCSPSAESVAAAILARKAREWTDADLAAIQQSANEAAAAIRGLQGP
jgi:Pyruvate/2-oxoacid:ferredoxin oxidoreductase gamma subunit